MADKDKYADEIMSDEELDNVAGGGTRQICGDNAFLKSFGYSHYDGTFLWDVSYIGAARSVDKGWSQAGVTCVTKFGCPDNLYFIGGKEVSRKDAFRHVLRQKGYSEASINNYDFDKWAGSF